MRKKMCIVFAVFLALTMTFGLVGCNDGDTKPDTYTVTVSGGTGGGAFAKGTAVTVTATVPEGKEFASWTAGGAVVSTYNPYTFNVTGDITLTAAFNDKTPETPELEELEDVEYFTVVADGGVIVGETDNQFKKGTEITVRATVPEFFEFECWETGGKTYTEQPEFKYTVSGNMKFTAVLTAVSRYKLELTGCTSESVYAGGVETVTVTANTVDDYLFVDWTINGETVEAPATYEFDLLADTTVVANFKRINIAIGAETSNAAVPVTLVSDAGDPEPATYEEGDTITVTAAVRNGIELLRWTDADGKFVSKSNPYTFTASEDVALTAVFGPIFAVTLTGGTFAGTEKTEDVYGEGGACAVEAIVGEHEMFVNWTTAEGNVISTANPYVFTVAASVALTAHVKEVTSTTYVFEAENADLSKNINQNGNPGNVEFHGDDDHGDPGLNAANKCSNGYVAACFNQTVNNTIAWRVNSDADAKAVLIIRMGNGSWISETQTKDINLDPTKVEVRVNGVAVEYEPFVLEGRTALPGSGKLSVYGFAADYTIAAEIDLKKDEVNVIEMQLMTIGYGPNVDALKLMTDARLTWTPTDQWGAPIAEHDYNV